VPWAAPADLPHFSAWRSMPVKYPHSEGRGLIWTGMQFMLRRYRPDMDGPAAGTWRLDARTMMEDPSGHSRHWEMLHEDKYWPAFVSAESAYDFLKKHWGTFNPDTAHTLREGLGQAVLPGLHGLAVIGGRECKWRRGPSGTSYALKAPGGWYFRLRKWPGGAWYGEFKRPGRALSEFEGGTWAHGTTPEEAAQALSDQVEAYKLAFPTADGTHPGLSPRARRRRMAQVDWDGSGSKINWDQELRAAVKRQPMPSKGRPARGRRGGGYGGVSPDAKRITVLTSQHGCPWWGYLSPEVQSLIRDAYAPPLTPQRRRRLMADVNWDLAAPAADPDSWPQHPVTLFVTITRHDGSRLASIEVAEGMLWCPDLELGSGGDDVEMAWGSVQDKIDEAVDLYREADGQANRGHRNPFLIRRV
jgi:hypothetical protein